MENVIVERVADFLKLYPPFNELSKNELYFVAEQVRVHYIPKRDFVFKIGDSAHNEFYVVQQGAVGLRSQHANTMQWIDICDEGDVLGLRPFFAEQTYAMQAIAKEECVLYGIPIEAFKKILFENKAVQTFLLESFASNTRNPKAADAKGKLLSTNYASTENETTELDFFQQAFYTNNPICLMANATVQKAALLMNEHNISSLLIEENQLPVGIITDKDIRKWVATGEMQIADKVHEIMSQPVYCVSSEISVAEAQTLLLQQKIGHLCVTQDGTNQSKIIGILSEHDVVTAQANNPVALLKQIQRVHKTSSLIRIRESLSRLLEAYLDMALPMPHIMKVSNAITQNLMHQIIEISENQLGKSPVNFTWLGIGSQGRGEQILLTDQDHALVFEDVPADQYKATQTYFLQLATKVSEVLHQLGYVYCPAEMMASNPKYCLSLTQWKTQFSKWIDHASSKSIMMCSIFFDFTKVYGNENLTTQLRLHIFKKLNGNQMFFAYLGEDALKNPPPLGFFRQFLIENDGKHKDEFDIKARAIQPLVDAARILVLAEAIEGKNNTVERFEQLAKLEPQNKEVYLACIKSFHTLSKFRAVEGFKQNTSGRYLNLSKLSKNDKMKLKRAFKPVQEIQSLLKNRFQLTHFL